MTGASLTTATLIACSLLLLLVHLELKMSAPLATSVESENIDTLSSPPLPPPQPEAYIEPTCQVTFGRAKCIQGDVSVPCPEKVDVVRHSTHTLATGAWVLAPTYTCPH